MRSANPSHLPLLPAGPVLDWKIPVGVLMTILFLFMPLAIWIGAVQPSHFEFLIQPWPQVWAQWMAVGCMGMLLFIPMIWVAVSRTLDLLALFLAQNCLLMAGYFFLNVTAWKLDGVGAAILETGSLMVFINTLGFVLLFIFMGGTYAFANLTSARLPALRSPPGDYDSMLIWFLRIAGISVALVLALPMLVSGSIPLLSEDPVVARANLVQSDAVRPLYLAGTAVLPFVTSGLILWIIRKPIRALGLDGWIAAVIIVIQILTSNRLPIAITLFATLTLATLEKKLPRSVLMLSFVVFLIFFAGLSGFTAILRQDRSALHEGNVVTKSIQEAFLGDNLIDLRDGSWVVSQWDFEPLMGKTYLGGLVSMVPSGVFPKKKEWHLGMNALRIVGWEGETHFGLRVSFFGESFLNFGPAGVVGLALVLGVLFGVLLRALHLAAGKKPACLHYNLKIIVLMQMGVACSNTGDAFNFWGMVAFLFAQWIFVDLGLRLRKTPPSHELPRAPWVKLNRSDSV